MEQEAKPAPPPPPQYWITLMSSGIGKNHLEIFLCIRLEKNSLLSHMRQGGHLEGHGHLLRQEYFPIFNVSELGNAELFLLQAWSACGPGSGGGGGRPRSPPPPSGADFGRRSYCYGNEPWKLFEPPGRATFTKERTNQGHSVKSGKNQRREA